MIKEKGHGSREGGGAFMSNTNYMEIINSDKRRRDTVVGKGGGAFMSNTNYQRIEI